MYAIIKIGGNQYRVEPGTCLEVDHLESDPGETMDVPALLVVDDQKNVKVGKEAAEVGVTLKIDKHTLGEKIHVSRFRHKVRHRRHIGFRPHLTQVTVESIGQVKKTAEKPAKSAKPKAPKTAKAA